MSIIQTHLVKAAEAIRKLYPTVDYDHRPFLSPRDTSYEVKMTEEFRKGYACFKYAVAKVLQPKTICEIGIGSGIAASAFLEACPDALYVGIDNLLDEKQCRYPFLEDLHKRFTEKRYNFRFVIADSTSLEKLPDPGSFSLIHVDASHIMCAAHADTLLALRSGSEWILVDDARDTQVLAGTAMALWTNRPGSMEYETFADSWTGNFLISQEPAH